MRKKFTDRFIKSLRAAPSGKRIEYWDTIVHGLGVRVTDRGVKSYVMYRRWPGSTAPTRRKIHSEHATDLSLDLARKIARQWLELLAQGIDPKTKELDEKNAKQREAQVTFGAVFEDWLRDDVSRMAKCDEIKRAIRWEFRDWFGRPITGIQTIEVRNIIKNKSLGLSPAPKARKTGPAPEQARNLLGCIKQLFSYAVDQHAYGLERSPADPLRGDKLCGRKVRRKRVLSDDELREVWSAAEETEYPYGPLIQMLIRITSAILNSARYIHRSRTNSTARNDNASRTAVLVPFHARYPYMPGGPESREARRSASPLQHRCRAAELGLQLGPLNPKLHSQNRANRP
jgi:hypothetical protein